MLCVTHHQGNAHWNNEISPLHQWDWCTLNIKNWPVLVWIWGKSNPHPLLGKEYGSLKKAKNWAFIWLSDFIPKNPRDQKSLFWKHICAPTFKVSLFSMNKTWKEPKCLRTDEKLWHMHNRILMGYKRKAKICLYLHGEIWIVSCWA